MPTGITALGSKPAAGARDAGVPLRDLAPGIEHHGAEVLVVDGSPCGGRGLVDDHAAFGDLGRRAEAGQPTVGHPPDSPELARSAAAEPDVETRLDRAGTDRHAFIVESGAVVVNAFLGPESTDQGERFVEPRRRVPRA